MIKRNILKLYYSLEFIKFKKSYYHLNNLFSYSDVQKNIKNAMRFIRMNRIKGDYAEFGVYEGSTFIPAVFFSKIFKLNKMRYYAFDSFEGLPDPREGDKGFWWKKNDYRCSLNKFKNILLNNKIDLSEIEFIKGFYNKTLKDKNSYGIDKLSFVHIDCDYYSSTKEVLDYITPFIQEGTVILFDDWYCYKGNRKKGEQKAFYEFVEKNNIIYFNLPTYGLKKMIAISGYSK